MVTNKQIKKVLNTLNSEINFYKEFNQKKIKRNWKNYEYDLYKRVQYAILGYEYYIDRAIEKLSIVKTEKRGCKPKLTLKQKVTLLLLKQLINKSNREMEVLCLVFSALSGVFVSYKTIERLYSDEEVSLVLHNMQTLFMKKIDTSSISACGDGTGYSLTISKHYASEAQKLKDIVKEAKTQNKHTKSKKKKKSKKQCFAYAFKLMDLKSREYISFGTSFKSEQKAYDKAIEMALNLKINISEIRLDRYYSKQCFVKDLSEKFLGIKFYLIPKSNATIKGCSNWHKMLSNFIKDVQQYLTNYYLRNNSESGFSEDKRRFGWKILQKKPERVNTCIFTKLIWHNLFWLGGVR